MTAPTEARSAGRIRCVLVCGGRWHDFEYARWELLGLLREHPRVRTSVFQDYRGVDELGEADVLITYACDLRPDAEQQRRLVEFVERGGRWLALHGTNAAIDPPSGDEEKRYSTPRVLGPVAEVLGSQFLGHPPIAPHQVEPVRPDHDLVRGVGAFTVTDELYVSRLHEPIDVLLATTFLGESPGFVEGDVTDPGSAVHPVLYLREHGLGEVCYFTLGHCRGPHDVQDLGIDDTGVVDRGSWTSPEFRTVLERCIARVVGVGAGEK